VRKPRQRLLPIAALAAGLLAVGAGAVGLITSGHAHAALHLVGQPSILPVPSQAAEAPGGLSAARPPALPVELTIPVLGVRAPMVHLGLEQDGSLQVPSSVTVAGWYTGSPRPGAVGSSVIAGHVDSLSGPGVFYRLGTLRPGDRVSVSRADGTMAVFSVTKVLTYAKDEFPTADVYGPSPDPELRLITCGGTFDPATGHYLSNVVAYAALVPSPQ
jgi:LPXTG-site transpeptidase (sortase) family protein